MIKRKVNKSGSISYMARVKSPTGRYYYKTFRTIKEAESWKEQEKAKKYRGEYVDTSGRITIEKYFEEFIESIAPRLQERSEEAYRLDIKNHIVPFMGNRKLKDVTYKDGTDFQKYMQGKGLNNKTVNKVVAILKQGLKNASSYFGRRRYLDHNPLGGLPALPTQGQSTEYWIFNEAQDFLKKIGDQDHNRYVYALAINGGFRLGEIAALQRKKIDFKTNVLTISNSLVRRKGGGFRLGPTKNKKTRYFPMTLYIRKILELVCEGKRPDEFLFLDENGGHIDVNHFCERRFRPLQERVGMEKNIRFHDLRHTYASIFMMNGGNFASLQELMGHKDRKSTDIYAHLAPQFLQKAASVVRVAIPELA